ncbi:MAG: hypothetical protein U0694_11040 [Anaerolineae bacterium]
MSDVAGILWYVNNEYRKRLAQAQTYLGLLEQLLQGVEALYPETLLTLRYTLAEIAALTDEHRAWRHHYYYDSSGTGRMVHSEHHITSALSHFHRMRTQHIQHLENIRVLFNEVARPDLSLTSIAHGDDLWDKAMLALEHLMAFQDYLEGLRA